MTFECVRPVSRTAPFISISTGVLPYSALGSNSPAPLEGGEARLKSYFYCVIMFHKEPRSADAAWHSVIPWMHPSPDGDEAFVLNNFWTSSERSPLWLLILSCLLFSWMSSSFCSVPSAGADRSALWRCSSGRSLTWMSWMCRREGIPPNTMWVVSLLHFCEHVFGKAPQMFIFCSDPHKWEYFHLIDSRTFAVGLCLTWHHLWWSSGCIQRHQQLENSACTMF